MYSQWYATACKHCGTSCLKFTLHKRWMHLGNGDAHHLQFSAEALYHPIFAPGIQVVVNNKVNAVTREGLHFNMVPPHISNRKTTCAKRQNSTYSNYGHKQCENIKGQSHMKGSTKLLFRFSLILSIKFPDHLTHANVVSLLRPLTWQTLLKESMGLQWFLELFLLSSCLIVSLI